MKSLAMPFQVGWDITHHCNFRCKHCYFTAEQLSDPSTFSLEEALLFVDHLAEKKVFHLAIAGGEPLLLPHLPLIIKRATSKGMRVALSTNASLLNRELAKELWSAGLKSLQISLDGHNAEINDSIRGKGSFDKTYAGLEVARKQGFSILLAVVLLKRNIDFIDDYLALAAKLNVVGVKVQTLIDSGLAATNDLVLRPALGAVVSVLRDLWSKKNANLIPFELILPLIDGVVMAEGSRLSSASCIGCKPGLSTVRVNANGDVRACGGAVNGPTVGNVRERALQAIWRDSAELTRWRNDAEVKSGNSATACGSLCGKGCRSQSAPAWAKTVDGTVRIETN